MVFRGYHGSLCSETAPSRLGGPNEVPGIEPKSILVEPRARQIPYHSAITLAPNIKFKLIFHNSIHA